jgi:hypothetical protein
VLKGRFLPHECLESYELSSYIYTIDCLNNAIVLRGTASAPGQECGVMTSGIPGDILQTKRLPDSEDGPEMIWIAPAHSETQEW